jgi:hypothetical protein
MQKKYSLIMKKIPSQLLGRLVLIPSIGPNLISFWGEEGIFCKTRGQLKLLYTSLLWLCRVPTANLTRASWTSSTISQASRDPNYKPSTDAKCFWASSFYPRSLRPTGATSRAMRETAAGLVFPLYCGHISEHRAHIRSEHGAASWRQPSSADTGPA